MSARSNKTPQLTQQDTVDKKALITAVLLAILIMLVDGYDLQILALIVPVLAESWNVPASDFGLM